MSGGTVVVTLRSGLVMSRKGGILGRMLPLFRLGVGGRIGSGKQVMSWIGLSEWVAAARFLLGRADIAGPVNLTTPNPVSNAEFTESLELAAESGVKFAGVLCGRATWKDGIPIYAKQGRKAFEEWMQTEGVKNIQNVNERLKAATPWYEMYGVRSEAELVGA